MQGAFTHLLKIVQLVHMGVGGPMSCNSLNAGWSHLLKIIQPVNMGVRGQVDAQVAAVQGGCTCTQPQQ